MNEIVSILFESFMFYEFVMDAIVRIVNGLEKRFEILRDAAQTA